MHKFSYLFTLMVHCLYIHFHTFYQEMWLNVEEIEEKQFQKQNTVIEGIK